MRLGYNMEGIVGGFVNKKKVLSPSNGKLFC